MTIGFAPAAMAYAGALPAPEIHSARQIKPPARQPRPGLRHKVLARLAGPGAGACFSLALLAAAGAAGAVKGGHYAAFVAAEGEPSDVLAKALGFSIKAVTIAGSANSRSKTSSLLPG
jgi:cell division protein FtsQ